MLDAAESSVVTPRPESSHQRLSQRRALALAEAVAARRTERGLSVPQLAALSRLNRQVIWRIERADANPTLQTVYAIADGLGITFNELFAGQAPANEPGAQAAD